MAVNDLETENVAVVGCGASIFYRLFLADMLSAEMTMNSGQNIRCK